ncbi:MAG: NAD(P)-dependent oxidoreductase, partial [Flavobacteriia bacterium]|nr:NAD(P)-dependent oxidoreductase [Flavobacteriia bacterium]
FSGTQKTPYREDDPTAPINRYGQSKRLGEEALFQASPSAIFIRTSWLFSPFGNNFVKTILGRLAEGQALKVVDDQWARPTYGIDLAHAVLGLLNHPKVDQHHCYHFANSGVTNWYGLAQAIARHRGLETTITPLPSDQYPTAAHRPTYSVLDTQRIENTCNLVPRSWEEALKDCLHYL